MTAPRYLEIDGRRYLWPDILQLRRTRKAAYTRSAQPPLFELTHDPRPATERTAAGPYCEPSLFSDW
jgi:hypothetical protein